MKIIYFAPIYFDDLKQRPQHIAEELSKKHDVYYIEPTISFIRYFLKGGRSYKGIKYDKNANLKIIRLNGKYMFHKSIQGLDILNLNSLSEQNQLYQLVKNADIIWVGYSGWYSVIKRWKNKKIIYDKMDDNVELSHIKLLKYYIKKAEKEMLKISDSIIVSSEKFYLELQKEHKNVILMRNALDKNNFSEFFKGKLDFKPLDKKKGYNFVYFGTIGSWFNFDIISQILKQSEKHKVYLIGNNLIEKYIHPRVIYMDVMKKEELFQFVVQFDIFLYPFKKDDFLDTINPVKIYEYLAFNKPVIAVKSKETELLEQYCYLYDELLPQIEHYERPFHDITEWENFIDENCWEYRLKELDYFD